MKRKLLSFFTAASLLLAALPYTAFAAAENRYFYNQLSSEAKDVYNYVSSNIASLRNSNVLHITKQISSQEEADSYGNTITKAIEAFLDDRSDVFWTGNSTIVSGSGYVGGDFTFDVTLRFGNSWASGARSIVNDENYVSAMVGSIVSTAKNQGDTIYDQLLWAHDWLTENNLYNSAAANMPATGYAADSTPWEAVSALDKNLSPVCEGYSRAFKLICDRLGVPCVLVSGGNHMWNHVKMDDGKWYAVDVTYDDPLYSIGGVYINRLQSGGENHKNFLVGSSGFADHVPDTNWKYPALNSTDYDPSNAQPYYPGSETPTTPAQPVNPAPGYEYPLFSDVPAGSWYYDYLYDLVAGKVIAGFNDGTFKPNGNVTYAQALKMIMLASGYVEQAKTGTHWASGYQQAAIAYGLMDKAVNLDKNISRYDIAILAAKALDLPAVRPIASPFDDMSVNNPAAPYVMALYDNEIFTGIGTADGRLVFKGGDTIKRSEISAVIWRIYQYMEDYEG